MKKLIVLAISVFCLISCQEEKNKLNKITIEIEQLNVANKKLRQRINSISNDFIEPFQMFENTVLNESKRSPDTIISKYKSIINKFPNSFWSHEAKSRIKNVQKRRKLWSKSKGWELLNVIPMKDMETISCPGC